MKRLLLILAVCCLATGRGVSFQVADNEVVRRFFDQALTSQVAYEQLRWLCKTTAGRIGGSPQAAAAVEYTRQVMEGMGLDSVWLQPCLVKSWDRGEPEVARIVSARYGTIEVPSTALGWSVGTGEPGLSARVVEVTSLDELKALGNKGVQGRIVFFNQPMDQTLPGTFAAYGKAAWQRTNGPAEAARLGAIGCVIRSLAIDIDDHPHTGVTRYGEGVRPIPAIAISTRSAERLSSLLKEDPELYFYFRTTCAEGPDVPSFNVIGEIRGAEFPNEIITVGGHLDAWDNGEGAHDDGGGCVQAIEMLRLFRSAGIQPRHTIRAVMFMDEEVAQRGGRAYAKEAAARGEVHIAALESDRGVFRPLALGVACNAEQMKKLQSWQPLFDPWGIRLTTGGGGVDIGFLKEYYPNIVLMGLVPDDARYFGVHHSSSDLFETVDRREMQLGAAAITSLICLIDRYGL
ncbi:MAG: M20/M25/M40 family metallo-hydrolase [Bacteroidales bacterium]